MYVLYRYLEPEVQRGSQPGISHVSLSWVTNITRLYANDMSFPEQGVLDPNCIHKSLETQSRHCIGKSLVSLWTLRGWIIQTLYMLGGLQCQAASMTRAATSFLVSGKSRSLPELHNTLGPTVRSSAAPAQHDSSYRTLTEVTTDPSGKP